MNDDNLPRDLILWEARLDRSDDERSHDFYPWRVVRTTATRAFLMPAWAGIHRIERVHVSIRKLKKHGMAQPNAAGSFFMFWPQMVNQLGVDHLVRRRFEIDGLEVPREARVADVVDAFSGVPAAWRAPRDEFDPRTAS